jgi:hypothetical protein
MLRWPYWLVSNLACPGKYQIKACPNHEAAVQVQEK